MDIVVVSYNSEKWLRGCIDSLGAVREAGEFNVYIIDNKSTDRTADILMSYNTNHHFKHFSYHIMEDNLGFAKANNVGARLGKDEIICFINVDTMVCDDTFKQLFEEIVQSDIRVAAWEMRQLPYEHPKIYDILTREVSWMSGAAFAIKRKVFEYVGGFDEALFMYAEDVDLSWKIRNAGYCIKYCPKVRINHFSYQEKYEVKPQQFLNSIINNLLLRYRYGGSGVIIKGHYLFWKVVLLHKNPFKNAKKQLLLRYIQHFKQGYFFWKTRIRNNGIAQFLNWDYEVVRAGSFEKSEISQIKPKVSILVRTCQRPTVLRETLISLRNQTYSNFEVVVVEDGPASAKKMIEDEFSDLDIIYFATEKKMGRSFAGNIALSKATGEYVNFLDDDDLFYADHIETLISKLVNEKSQAAYSYGFETPIEIESVEPYSYVIKGMNKRYEVLFNAVELCFHNYIPIQCIMFSKQLYDKYGGFDTELDYLEDWDLWLRYAQETAFICVPKTTSVYRIPAQTVAQKERQKKLDQALTTLREKHRNYKIQVSAADLSVYYQNNRSVIYVIANSIRNLWK